MPVIVIEGVNGAGTSTQSKMLFDYLKDEGKNVIVTSHPGSTCLGKELRKILKYGDVNTTPQQELILFAADFMSFYQEILLNMDIDDDYVICDRLNITGALTYQVAGGATEIQVSSLLSFLEDLGWQMNIDYLFILSASYDVIKQRIEKPNLVSQDMDNGNKKDRFELKGKAFLEKVCDNYNKLSNNILVNNYFDKVYDIDGSNKPDEVFDQIISKLK